MKKKKQKRRTLPVAQEPAPRLADLLRSQGLEVPEPNTPAPEVPAPPEQVSLATIVARSPKLRLRVERKGRRGKTVTLIEGLQGTQDELGRVAQALRKALGCGAGQEESTLVLQGKQLERARAWLRKHGSAG